MTQRRLPAPRTPDPMAAPPLRWGILAPGWIAGQFAAALRRGTRQRIAAVGSRNLDRARAFADEHGAPTAYGSYDELVHDPHVDIVYVASPHSEHHRQARLALEAGKPVLVEKAFTRNAAEARDLIDLARANGLFVLEGMWSRFLPHYDVIDQAVHDGLIGEVTTVFADHGQHLYPDGPDRLASPDLAGGALLDLAVYPISFADFVLGPLTTVTATGSLTDRGVDQQESRHRGQRGRRARRPARLHARRITLHRNDLRHRRPPGDRRHLLPALLGHAPRPRRHVHRPLRPHRRRRPPRPALRGRGGSALPDRRCRRSHRCTRPPPPCGSWKPWTRSAASSASTSPGNRNILSQA